MSTPVYRNAGLSEIALLLDWAAAEGWNPGLDDDAAFHAADPQGFFVAELDGTPVAGISVVNHSPQFAFLGLYLCLPEHRGRGIGYGLWRHALAHAGERTIGLDGVAAQQANYAKSGFALTGRTVRFEGRFPATQQELPLASPDQLPRLIELDKEATGTSRPAFLTSWTAQEPSRKTVVSAEGGHITGFATARLCRSGCKIGPVVAPSVSMALLLATQAAAALGCEQVAIDIPDGQGAFEGLLRARDFAETFATARMYRGAVPATGETGRAIASMELG
ncbi:GNAT family N-acetyltransferase [Pseudoroseicyclus sp. H15]